MAGDQRAAGRARADRGGYATLRVADDGYAVSYLAESGYTLTVGLDFRTNRLVGIASGASEWFPGHEMFEVVD